MQPYSRTPLPSVFWRSFANKIFYTVHFFLFASTFHPALPRLLALTESSDLLRSTLRGDRTSFPIIRHKKDFLADSCELLIISRQNEKMPKFFTLAPFLALARSRFSVANSARLEPPTGAPDWSLVKPLTRLLKSHAVWTHGATAVHPNESLPPHP